MNMLPEDASRIIEKLGKYPILAAYLFGSQATQKASALSDIDIALLVSPSTNKPQRFDFRLRLTNDLSSVLGKRVDLIILNDAPLMLQYEAIKHGSIILCNDRELRIDMETRILSKYLDRRYYEKRRAAIILNRISKGTMPA